jgi:hypothetical protein
MLSKIREINGLTIDFSRTSIEIFPAIKELPGSDDLYLKFSKNIIRSLELQKHAELLMDFDFCLINRSQDETIIQLLAIFLITENHAPVNNWRVITAAVDFGRSMIIDEIQKSALKDMAGNEIRVPEFLVTPESINHFM